MEWRSFLAVGIGSARQSRLPLDTGGPQGATLCLRKLQREKVEPRRPEVAVLSNGKDATNAFARHRHPDDHYVADLSSDELH
jgi:hypothetical protein